MMRTGWRRISIAAVLVAAAFATAQTAAPPVSSDPAALDHEAEWRAQYADIVAYMKSLPREARVQVPAAPRREPSDKMARAAQQAYRDEATILPGDRDPADVVVRRVGALLGHMKKRYPRFDGQDLARELIALRKRLEAASIDDAEARLALYHDACRLRRRVMFAHPKADFDRVLFIKKHFSRASHMCDQYFGKNARGGGGLYVLEDPFGPSPRIRDVLAGSVVEKGRLKGQTLEGGGFLSPDLSYDGRTVVFAYSECEGGGWEKEACFHIFEVNVDGTGLVQLTDGPTNDFDPCFLPNGRILFNSERRGGFGRCHGRPVPTYTLHSMNADGTDIVTNSYHETNEWHPSVNSEGLVVYSRWDYVDRDSDIAHHPWITTPDGRDARALHGNFPIPPHGRNWRPWMELDVKSIPGSHRYIATAAPHHGQAFGSLVLLDPDIEDDDVMSQLERITPDTLFPESEGSRGLWVYGTAWPLSEDLYLCVHRPVSSAKGGTFGIYLLDSFGNRELLYRDASIHCQSPMPLRARPRPPVVTRLADVAKPKGDAATGEGPPRSTDASTEGTVLCVDVYDGLLPWPEGTRIEKLRIIQLFPKATPKSNRPRINIGSQSLARGVLGTVPVEEDGSCYFKAPAGKSIYFQALDAEGRAVQSMRSLTYVQPGQRLACQGCHEPRYRAPSPPPAMPLALRREPSEIEPDVEGSYPLLYPRLVQPVLDRHCVACHKKQKDAPDLDGTVLDKNHWTQSYAVLARMGFWLNGGNGAIRHDRTGGSRTYPGEFGALASPLYEKLRAGHKGVKLPAGDLYRITLWLDCNTNFFGAYRETEAQAKGIVVTPEIE